ncbi:CBS domain-containing protein, partial [candidate division KSB1 bacterium]
MNSMKTDHLHASVTTIARRDFSIVHQDLTIRQTLDEIREQGLGEKIVYFYVVDDDGILRGVLPTHRLLIAALEQRLCDVMIKRIVTIPQGATVLDACEAFVMYKFLAFPIVFIWRGLGLESIAMGAAVL